MPWKHWIWVKLYKEMNLMKSKRSIWDWVWMYSPRRDRWCLEEEREIEIKRKRKILWLLINLCFLFIIDELYCFVCLWKYKNSQCRGYKKEIEENDYSAQSEIGKWTIQSTIFMEKNKNRHYSIILSHTSEQCPRREASRPGESLRLERSSERL